MDDINVLSASLPSNTTSHTYIIDRLKNNTYDQTHKNLSLKPTDEHTFLDSHIVISNDSQSVKITYNNKNHTIIQTNTQSVGRFHHRLAPSHLTHKLSAAQTIFIKIHDFTTHLIDFPLPCFSLIHELYLLNYTTANIISILTKVNRSRPHFFWTTLSSTLIK